MAFFTLEKFKYISVEGETDPFYFLGWIISSKISEKNNSNTQKLFSFGCTPSKLFPQSHLSTSEVNKKIDDIEKILNPNHNTNPNINTNTPNAGDKNKVKRSEGLSQNLKDTSKMNDDQLREYQRELRDTLTSGKLEKDWVEKSYPIELPVLTKEEQTMTVEINFCLYKVFSEKQLEYLQQLFKSPSSFDDFSKKIKDNRVETTKNFFQSIQSLAKVGEFIPLPGASTATFEILKNIPQAFEFVSNCNEWLVRAPFLWDQFQLRFIVDYKFPPGITDAMKLGDKPYPDPTSKRLQYDTAKSEKISEKSNDNKLSFIWTKNNNYKTKVTRSKVRGITNTSFSLNLNAN